MGSGVKTGTDLMSGKIQPQEGNWVTAGIRRDPSGLGEPIRSNRVQSTGPCVSSLQGQGQGHCVTSSAFGKGTASPAFQESGV